MRHICRALALLLVLLPFAARALTPAEARTLYAVDKQKVLTGDLAFDWQQFRLAAVQGGADSFDWHPVRNQFMQKMQAHDAKAALALADQIIGHNMAEPEGHLLAMIADRELGKTEDAGLQRNIVGAWVASLQHSGDGKTQQTAIFVVNEGEEYLYINLVYSVGLPQMQSLVQANGHSFDKLHIKDEKGVEQDVWFNVDTSLNAMRDAIQRGK